MFCDNVAAKLAADGYDIDYIDAIGWNTFINWCTNFYPSGHSEDVGAAAECVAEHFSFPRKPTEPPNLDAYYARMWKDSLT